MKNNDVYISKLDDVKTKLSLKLSANSRFMLHLEIFEPKKLKKKICCDPLGKEIIMPEIEPCIRGDVAFKKIKEWRSRKLITSEAQEWAIDKCYVTRHTFIDK